MAEAPGEPAGHNGHRDLRQRSGRDREAGTRQVVMPHAAHVEEEREEHHGERDAEGKRGSVRCAVNRVAEKGEVDERIAHALRPANERDERDDSGGRHCREIRARPVRGVRFNAMASATEPTAMMRSAIPTPSTRRRVAARSDSGSRYAPRHSEYAPRDSKYARAAWSWISFIQTPVPCRRSAARSISRLRPPRSRVPRRGGASTRGRSARVRLQRRRHRRLRRCGCRGDRPRSHCRLGLPSGTDRARRRFAIFRRLRGLVLIRPSFHDGIHLDRPDTPIGSAHSHRSPEKRLCCR
jgi:hypothetical protein